MYAILIHVLAATTTCGPFFAAAQDTSDAICGLQPGIEVVNINSVLSADVVPMASAISGNSSSAVSIGALGRALLLADNGFENFVALVLSTTTDTGVTWNSGATPIPTVSQAALTATDLELQLNPSFFVFYSLLVLPSQRVSSAVLLSPDDVLSFTFDSTEFQLTEKPLLTTCRNYSIVVALVPVSAEVKESLASLDGTLVDVSTCTLPIVPNLFFRICPNVRHITELALTTSLTLFDTAIENFTFTASFESGEAVFLATDAVFTLKDVTDEVDIPVTSVLTTGGINPVFTLSFNKKFEAETQLQLQLVFGSQETSRTLHAVSFASAVELSAESSSSVSFNVFEPLNTVNATFASSFIDDSVSGKAANSSCLMDCVTLTVTVPAANIAPQTYSCTFSTAACNAGEYLLFFVRRPELQATTLQHQTPIKVTIGDANESPPQVISAVFDDKLTGLVLTLNSTTPQLYRSFACQDAFYDAKALGDQPSCQVTRSTVYVVFGPGATLTPTEQLLVLHGAFTTSFFENGAPASGQYDVVSLSVDDAVVTPKVVLVGPSNIIRCQENINVTVLRLSGDGGRDLTYTWSALGDTASDKLKELLESATTNSVIIPTADLEMDSPTQVQVMACNYAGKCAESNAVDLTISDDSTEFSVGIDGIPTVLLPSVKVTLSAVPSFVYCATESNQALPSISYEWQVNGTVASHDSVFVIPPKRFETNVMVLVSLSANYTNPENGHILSAGAQEVLHFAAEPITVILDGTLRGVAASNALIINASTSVDPNTGSRNLGHSWSCQLPDNSPCGLEINIDWMSSSLTIPANTLTVGMLYVFTDIVSNLRGAGSSATAVIEVLSSKGPAIEMAPIQHTQISISDYFQVQAYVSAAPGQVTAQWFLFRQPDNESIDLLTAFPHTRKSFAVTDESPVGAVSFTLPSGTRTRSNNWAGLSPGEYFIRLSANNSAGCTYTDVNFEVVSPPEIVNFAVEPKEDITALTSTVTLVVDRIDYAQFDRPITVKFGLRSVLVGGKSIDYFFRPSASLHHQTVLPAAWPEPHAACGVRVGYQGIVEVCDLDASCSTAYTDEFVVQHPLNANQAIEDMIENIKTDIGFGDVDGAFQKIVAVQYEQCNDTIDTAIADAFIDRVGDGLLTSPKADDLMDAVYMTTAVLKSASPERVEKVLAIIANATYTAQTTGNGKRRRRSKRASTPEITPLNMIQMPQTASKATAVENEAQGLLTAYDQLLGQNQDVATGYLSMVQSFLEAFCSQIDSSRVLVAEGAGYTVLNAEGIAPEVENFETHKFDVAGIEAALSFDDHFASKFTNYKCGDDKNMICSDVCLASAFVAAKAFTDSSLLGQIAFGNPHNPVTLANAASDFYRIMLVDPQTNKEISLPSGVTYSLTVPLTHYSPSHYYSCFVNQTGVWDNSICTSNSSATVTPTGFVVACNCKKTGTIAVFSISPPKPKIYPAYNEIKLTFTLTSACNSGRFAAFIEALSTASGLDSSRFINPVCDESTDSSDAPQTLSMTLRPRFKETQVTNSYAVQAIQRAVAVGDLRVGNAGVSDVSAEISTRDLVGDGLARRVSFHIDRSLKDAAGNDSAGLARRWAASLAASTALSTYRFKNPSLTVGMLFNVTLTLPFAGESTDDDAMPLSAEEISVWLSEMSRLDEITLRDANNQRVPVDPLGIEDIVILKVLKPTNTLTTVLTVAVPTVCVAIALAVGGLVALKLRTDRLIEEQNSNIRIIQLDPNGPPVSVIPDPAPNALAAADTVVFGASKRRVARPR